MIVLEFPHIIKIEGGDIMGSPIFCRAPICPGLDYTERQLAILEDEVPIENIRTTELVALMKKTRERKDELNYDIAKGLYDLKLHPCEYMPHYTTEEAKSILQSLTPWKIEWGKSKRQIRKTTQ